MTQNNRELKLIIWGFSLVAVLFTVFGTYSYRQFNFLASEIDTISSNIASINANMASTTDDLRSKIDKTHTSLSTALSAEKQNVGAIREQLGGFQNQVGTISGTLSNIQKLAEIDPELLKKYSKAYFLNENYIPRQLSEIPKDYQYSDLKQMLFYTQAEPYLESMIKAASSTGIKLYVFSAYRSFDEQAALKGKYTITYGAGTANTFSADQGYSEHQLGTTVDMITPGLGGQLEGFEKTPAYDWMLKNAYKYGFVLSYPKDNDYYVFEPWHWRFVGVKLATYLHDQKKTFLDLDQKTINTYLLSIFD